MSEELIRQPPKPIPGVEYEWLPQDRICQECARLMLEGNIVVKRNARGRSAFKDILPPKNGICMNCAADVLSELSIREYERVLIQIDNYQALAEKAELTERELKSKNFLEHFINNLRDFIGELSDFNLYVEKSGVAYYDDQLEVEDDS